MFYLGISWDTETRLFPKTTLCDFTVREFGHPKLAHEYTVPCVLPLNLFNQQMFTVLYFWYAMVILLNIGDFILWLYTISPQNRRAFIRKRLHSKKYPLTNETRNQENINIFANDYLEADGFFMLILIKENSSDFVASEIERGDCEGALRRGSGSARSTGCDEGGDGESEELGISGT